MNLQLAKQNLNVEYSLAGVCVEYRVMIGVQTRRSAGENFNWLINTGNE